MTRCARPLTSQPENGVLRPFDLNLVGSIRQAVEGSMIVTSASWPVFSVPFWILVLGGVGIVVGLAIWGKNVIATVGEGIIQLQPSGGFCAELATAATVLLASRLGLPVSTSHALVGAVVGVGLVKGWKSVRFQTCRS